MSRVSRARETVWTTAALAIVYEYFLPSTPKALKLASLREFFIQLLDPVVTSVFIII